MRRRLQVRKLRARAFREGFHDFAIRRGGIQVFPRLVAAEHRRTHAHSVIGSGIPHLDELLGGGIDRGTSTLIMGAAGTGKSSLATQYVKAAGERGEKAAVFLFDESLDTYLQRAAGLGQDVRPLVESGLVLLQQVDPAEMSPGEFAHLVRRAVHEQQLQLVVFDSLNGYLHAMPSDRFLLLHLHELLMYLGQKGVTTLLLMAQHGLLDGEPVSPVDASYLADAIMLLRYFEDRGRVRQAVSVIKKRTGAHERTIRELQLRSDGILVGPPLREFQGVLTGSPAPAGNIRNGDS